MQRLRSRVGMTLLEIGVVMAILGVLATLVVPALTDLTRTTPRLPGQELIDLLTYARRLAVDSSVNVAVLLDPWSGSYRIDSTGLGGAAIVEEGSLDLGSMDPLQTEAVRLRYYFRPTGAGLGDTVRVLGADSSVILWVDPWSGVPRAGNHWSSDMGFFP